MTGNDERDLAATYGPAARHVDHRVGDLITYKDADTSGRICSGVILWVCAPGEVAGRQMPMRYIVEPGEPTGFVDIVFASDLVMEPRLL